MIQENKNKVRTFIQEHAYGDKQKIKDDTLIFREGFFDSMGFIFLITFLEEEFKVQPNDEELIEKNFESIDAIANYTSKQLQPSV
jgi:acyl carrier protein